MPTSNRQGDGQRDHGRRLAFAVVGIDELRNDRPQITCGTPVVGQPSEQHAHRAGVGQRRKGQPCTDREGHPLDARHDDAGKDAQGHDQACHEPDLPLQVPALGTPDDREALCLPGGDSAFENVHIGQAGPA